ncbi:MAG: flagellar export chaperone FliS [Deltaproteobacteria bacterium]|nr:flagellar export chaperone FliS [Deltaproteobacteria bacterium]
MQQAVYQQEAQNNIPMETPSPGAVLLSLYDAAIRYVGLAKKQIEAGNNQSMEISLGKAYAIITEFMNSLDYEQSPELCANLEQVYDFMLAQLEEANLNMDPTPLGHVATHLNALRDAWAQVVTG